MRSRFLATATALVIGVAAPAFAMTKAVGHRGCRPGIRGRARDRQPTGPDRKTMTVTEGATVRGRLLGPDGKPVANAEVGISTHSRNSGSTLPEVRIGTREDGP